VNVPGVVEPRLPPAVAALIDGAGLEGKIGVTIVLTAVDGDGWPRQALLSVGEVLSVSGGDVLLALYNGSRTTRALASSGRALLTVVAAGAAYKVCIEVAQAGSADGLARFAGRVVAVDEDRVGYARITSGITYELPDPQPVLQRWGRQIDQLRAVAT
jgi:hypothetical protein